MLLHAIGENHTMIPTLHKVIVVEGMQPCEPGNEVIWAHEHTTVQ